MKILVVDDSPMMRRVIKKELMVTEYEIIEAEDGIDAIEMFEKHRPNLITMDVDMPRMNGFDTAKKIGEIISENQDGEQSKVPIVFVTASDTLEGRAKGFQAGAADFITKPFLPGEVVSTVQGLLKPDAKFKGMTALVVEDSATARKLITNILDQEGLKTIIGTNGNEGFRLMKEYEDEIDIVITDYMMPEMNGDAMCEKIRQELGKKTIPIIFLSGAEDKDSILKFFKAGASDYVNKPFAKEELLARIWTHLETRTLSHKLTSQVLELKRLSKLKDDFLSITSHDLRAPLNGILGFSELLLEEDLNETHKEYLSHIKNSGDFLLTLINDILDLGKLQSENNSVDFVELSIEELVESSTNTIRHMATPKKIKLDIEKKFTDPPYIKGDKNSLIRVFNNILSNAIKFTDKEGSVQQIIEHIENDDIVTISIFDDGIGIPEDKIPLLFDKYSKVSRPGTAGEKGTGLGLSITKQLIESHNGTVTVTSESGQGTCFKLAFPLAGKEP